MKGKLIFSGNLQPLIRQFFNRKNPDPSNDVMIVEDGDELPPIEGVNDGWRNVFCDYDDPEKNLGFLCPTNDGFVQLVELYFTQEVTMVLDDEDKRR